MCAGERLRAVSKPLPYWVRSQIQLGPSYPNVKVTLENVRTGVKVTATTDTDGQLHHLSTSVSASIESRPRRKASSQVSSDAFTLTVNARQRVNLTLQVGDVTQTVAVSGIAEALETESSDRGQVIQRSGDCQPALKRPGVCGPGIAIARRPPLEHHPTATLRST